MLCCIVGEAALSGSRPLHGTLERPNSGAPTRSGGGERGEGGKKTSSIRMTPNGMIVYVCVCEREREADGIPTIPVDLFLVTYL